MKTEFKADALLLVTAIIWGVALLPVSLALKTNDAFALLFWRFFASFLMMFLIAAFFAPRQLAKIAKNEQNFSQNSSQQSEISRRAIFLRSVKIGLFLGISLFAGVVLQTNALKYTQSSSVAFLVGAYVLIVPFVMYVFFKRKISVYACVGVVVGVIGLYFLNKTSLSLGLGEVLALCAALTLTFHIVFTGEFARKCEVLTLITTQFGMIALLCLIFSYTLRNGIGVNLDFAFWRAIVITTLFSNIFGFLAEAFMLRHTNALKAAIIFIFKPLVAALVGYFLGAENWSGAQIFGASLIIIAILISEIGSYLSASSKR